MPAPGGRFATWPCACLGAVLGAPRGRRRPCAFSCCYSCNRCGRAARQPVPRRHTAYRHGWHRSLRRRALVAPECLQVRCYYGHQLGSCVRREILKVMRDPKKGDQSYERGAPPLIYISLSHGYARPCRVCANSVNQEKEVYLKEMCVSLAESACLLFGAPCGSVCRKVSSRSRARALEMCARARVVWRTKAYTRHTCDVPWPDTIAPPLSLTASALTHTFTTLIESQQRHHFKDSWFARDCTSSNLASSSRSCLASCSCAAACNSG